VTFTLTTSSVQDQAHAQDILRAAYRQVFGNAHLMEEQLVATAESQFLQGDLTVQGLISALACSDTYRSLFLEKMVPIGSLNSTSNTCWAEHHATKQN